MSKAQFAEELGLSLITIEGWLKTNKFPLYIQNILEWAVKAKKYEDYLKAKEQNEKENDLTKIKNLEEEIQKIKSKIGLV